MKNNRIPASAYRKRMRSAVHSMMNGDFEKAGSELNTDNKKYKLTIHKEGEPYTYEGKEITEKEYNKLVDQGLIRPFTLKID